MQKDLTKVKIFQNVLGGATFLKHPVVNLAFNINAWKGRASYDCHEDPSTKVELPMTLRLFAFEWHRTHSTAKWTDEVQCIMRPSSERAKQILPLYLWIMKLIWGTKLIVTVLIHSMFKVAKSVNSWWSQLLVHDSVVTE